MVNCCVPFCKNRPDQKKFSFFSFPADEIKRQLWLDRIGRKNPDGSNWVPKMSAKVCSYHFSKGRSFGAPDRFDRGPVETKRWKIVPPKERKSSMALRSSLPIPWRSKLNLPEFPSSPNDSASPHANMAPVDSGTILTWEQAQPVPTPREPEVCSQHFADKFFRKYTGKPYVQEDATPEAIQERRALKRSAAVETCIPTKGGKQEVAPIMVTLLVPVMTVPMVPCGLPSSIMILQSPIGETASHPEAAGHPHMLLRSSRQQPQMIIGPSGQQQMVLGQSGRQAQLVLGPSGHPQMVLGPSRQQPQLVFGPSGPQQQMDLGSWGKLEAGQPQMATRPDTTNTTPIPINSWEMPTFQAFDGENRQDLECYQAALSALREQMSKLQREVAVLRQRATQTPPFAQLARVVSAAKEGQESALLLLEQILAYDSHLHYWSPQMLQKCTAWRARSCHSYLRALKMGLFSLPCTGTLSRAKTHGPSQRWQSQWMLLADLLLR